jgi:hypothetical protein
MEAKLFIFLTSAYEQVSGQLRTIRTRRKDAPTQFFVREGIKTTNEKQGTLMENKTVKNKK